MLLVLYHDFLLILMSFRCLVLEIYSNAFHFWTEFSILIDPVAYLRYYMPQEVREAFLCRWDWSGALTEAVYHGIKQIENGFYNFVGRVRLVFKMCFRLVSIR